MLSISYTCSNAQLNATDSLHLALLNHELLLNPSQTAAIDSLLRSTSSSIVSLDKEIARISRSDLDEATKTQQLTVLKEKKKLLKEDRELSIQLLLNSDQRKIYDEKIKPAKPAVLHMGMNHDRANCNVCLPK